MHIVPLVVGDERRPCELCQAALEQRRLRPGDPPADGRRRHLAPTADDDGLAHRRGAAPGRPSMLGAAARRLGLEPAGWRFRRARPDVEESSREDEELQVRLVRRTGAGERPHRRPVRSRARCTHRLPGGLAGHPPGAPARRKRAGPVRHRHRHGRRQDVLSAALLAAMAAAGENVRAHKPAVTGLDEPPGAWPADHELLGAVGGHGPRGGGATALRPGRLTAPGGGARRRDDRSGRLVSQAHEAATRAEAEGATLVVEGVGGLLVPLADRLQRAAISRSRSVCLWRLPAGPALARSTTRC